MEVKVIKVEEQNPGGQLVVFSTPYGTAKALWRVGVAEPQRSYAVELEIPDVLH